MPGVRGASRGCSTCKKRKVACDQARPECLRCVNSGRICGGYDKVPTFVNRDASNINASSRETLAEAFRDASQKGTSTKRSQSSRESSVSETAPTSIKTPNGQLKLQSRESVAMAARRGLISSSLKDNIVLRSTANTRAPMLGMLIQYYNGDEPSLHSSRIYGDFSELLCTSEMFDYAVSATALTRCGQVDQNSHLIYQGTFQYVKAIETLRDSLKKPALIYQDSTLAVCVLLSAYELLTGGTGTTLLPWLSHIEGVAHLIQKRGPFLHQTSFGHQIFLHFRANAVLRCIMTRKSLFLSQPEWLTIPFAITSKDSFHQLLDCIYDLCSILEAVDAVLPGPAGNFTRVGIATACEKLYAGYIDWYTRLKKSYPGPLYTIISAYPIVPEDDSPNGTAFTKYLQFTDLTICQTLITYWATLLLLHTTSLSNLRILHSFSSSTQSGTRINPLDTSSFSSSHSPPNPALEIPTLAHLIAQSIPYCLQDMHRTLGPFIVIHPLHAATQFFETAGDTRKVGWCKEVFSVVNVGGDPFADSEESTEKAGVEKGRGWKVNYQLALPKYGEDCFKLEF